MAKYLNNIRLGKDVRISRVNLFDIYGTIDSDGYGKTKHAKLERDLLFESIVPNEKNEAYWIYTAYYGYTNDNIVNRIA